MVAINFKAQFADQIRRGEKLQTIRVRRRDGSVPWKPGSALQLYTGMRTKRCTKLTDAVCTGVQPVRIDLDGDWHINGRTLNRTDRTLLAIADGFPDRFGLNAFFYHNHGFPFEGHMITWTVAGSGFVGVDP